MKHSPVVRPIRVEQIKKMDFVEALKELVFVRFSYFEYYIPKIEVERGSRYTQPYLGWY